MIRQLKIRWTRLLAWCLRRTMQSLDPGGELGPFTHTSQPIPFWEYETTKEALDLITKPLIPLGTRSVLCGYHCFFIHPWFVAVGWWKLYGLPWQPWLWIVFIVHDLGYWGKPNMDGDEGEKHPWFGAKVLYKVQTFWVLLHQPVFYRKDGLLSSVRWWQLRGRWLNARVNCDMKWGNMSLYHSRFLAKKYMVQPSRLCWADKKAITLYPRWFYMALVRLTGEIHEYMRDYKLTNPGAAEFSDMKLWHTNMCEYVASLVERFSDGSEDTATQDRGAARSARDDGVWL